MEQYKKIYQVGKDCIDRGGSEVITSLGRTNEDTGRNLVRIPLSDIKLAQENVSQRKGPFTSAEHEFLDFIRKLDINPDSKKGPGKPSTYNETLDIKIVDDSKGFDKETNEDNIIYITNDVSKETELRLQGRKVEQPRSLIVSSDIVNKGILDGSDDLVSRLFENKGFIPVEEAQEFFSHETLYPNTFVRFYDQENPNNRYAAQVVGNIRRTGDKIRDIRDLELRLFDERTAGVRMKSAYLGIKPRDLEQYLALHNVLINDDISMAFITGEQGSGKTLLTYIAAVWQILDFGIKEKEKEIRLGTELEKKSPHKRNDFEGFQKIILYKSNDVMGGQRRETGHLPGNLFAKMRPFLQSYEDCHNETSLGRELPFIDMFRHPHYPLEDFAEIRQYKGKIDGGYLPKHNQAIEFRYSGHARGVTLSDSLIVIDEAQNFTPYEIKTMCERVGKGSKLIIMGDPLQCDAIGHTSPEINGFTAAIQKYLEKPYSALVKLETNYRHQISDDARSWKGASN